MIATDEEVRAIVRVVFEELRKATDTPEGATAFSKMLRDQGWTCTPPRTKAAPKKRTRRG